jgi:predicted peroxiredoxin
MKKQVRYLTSIVVIAFAIYGVFSFAMSFQPTVVHASANESALLQDDAPPTPRPPDELKDGLFINMTTDDIDRAAMAVGFATKIRKNTGRPVTIFFNTQGVRLVDVDIPQNVHKSGNTIHEMIQMFMDEGGVALVCPVCMVNVGGMDTEDILPGVIIGSPEFTWSALFAENVTTLSY